MNKRTFLSLASAVLMCAGVYAQETAPTVITLEDALRIALSENVSVKVADKEIERAEYARKGTYASLFPQVAASGSFNRTIKKVRAEMDKYHFGQASSILYDFVYDDFCSFYLEMSKVSLAKEELQPMVKAVLYKVVKDIVLLIYPYCPFVMEEIYLSLPGHKESVMLESYPEFDKSLHSAASERNGRLLEAMIRDVRSYKSERKLAPNAPIKLILSPKSPWKGIEEYLTRFLFAKEVRFEEVESAQLDGFSYGKVDLYIEEDVNEEELRATLLKDREKLEFEVARGEKMLSNPGFVNKAPKEKLAAEQEKLAANKEKLAAEIALPDFHLQRPAVSRHHKSAVTYPLNIVETCVLQLYYRFLYSPALQAIGLLMLYRGNERSGQEFKPVHCQSQFFSVEFGLKHSVIPIYLQDIFRALYWNQQLPFLRQYR